MTREQEQKPTTQRASDPPHEGSPFVASQDVPGSLPVGPQPPEPLRAGKLPPALLTRLLARLPTHDERLLVGPSIGEDAAVVDFAPNAQTLLVIKSDPITFATDEIGYYAVHVCANDIGVAGARPLFYLPTLLLPAEGADSALAERIFTQMGAACRALGITVAGGHSEVTHTVSHPVVAGAMVGEVARGRQVHTGGCRPGDLILLAGSAAIEGTSLIARERRDLLLERGWTLEEVETAANFLFDPGISVLAPALAAADAGLVTSMHDPTEGGVATALSEVAAASGVGIEVELDRIPVASLTRRLCAEFGLDPLGTIGSGALLATCAPANVERLQALWQAQGRPSAVIGRALPVPGLLSATRSGVPCPFPTFLADEITRLWAE
jgi:hydrogenase maturation factor